MPLIFHCANKRQEFRYSSLRDCLEKHWLQACLKMDAERPREIAQMLVILNRKKAVTFNSFKSTATFI